MCLNRKPEGNQRKNFPSKDEIGHIHLKCMRENDRYLPMGTGSGRCFEDSLGF